MRSILRTLARVGKFSRQAVFPTRCVCYDKFFCCSSSALPTCRGAHYFASHSLPMPENVRRRKRCNQAAVYRFLLSVRLIFAQESDQSLLDNFFLRRSLAQREDEWNTHCIIQKQEHRSQLLHCRDNREPNTHRYCLVVMVLG